jgi:malate dehydrogenase (oxaloacetate-decarboxylating)
LAGLLNALQVVGKELDQLKIALIGMGAANVATYRLLKARGVDPAGIVACDGKGTLHKGRQDLEARQAEFADKWRVCTESNAEGIVGGIADALRGADVCLAFARPDPTTIKPEWVRQMARDAIVFACANPTPEIWPWDAKAAGATIVATGRSDFPNQVNNALVFPGIFRGTLEVRARTITDAMALAAAHELARYAEEQGLHVDRILPRMDDWEVVPHVAAATALQAQEQGVARLTRSREEVQQCAAKLVREAREATRLLMRAGLIPLESPGSVRPEVSSDGSCWSQPLGRSTITTSPAKEGSC